MSIGINLISSEDLLLKTFEVIISYLIRLLYVRIQTKALKLYIYNYIYIYIYLFIYLFIYMIPSKQACVTVV